MKTTRSWHTWAGVVLALPLFAVGATAVFIAHKESLEDVHVNVSWLPAYGGEAEAVHREEVETVLMDGPRAGWLGTKAGLYRWTDGRAEPVAGLDGVEVKSVVAGAGPWAVLVATKAGAWALDRAGSWSRVHDGDVHGLSASPHGTLYLTTNEHVLMSSDDRGASWMRVSEVASALADPRAPAARHAGTVPLEKLMKDIHTGKAFLGPRGEWLWIDTLGIALIVLACSGVVMWAAAQRRKARLVVPAAASPAVPPLAGPAAAGRAHAAARTPVEVGAD